MISRRLNRKFKSIRAESELDVDPGLSFANKWVTHLVALLKRHRGDKEFTNEVIVSAMEYFRDNMSEQDRLDVFALLLRRSVSGK